MMPRKTTIVVLVAIVVSFAAGFGLRPLIAPATSTPFPVSAAPSSSAPVAARGTQYFVANIDKARQIVAGCRAGSVRGGECATAEEAIITVDADERRRKFLGK
ncbi:hypothetical protein [Chelatococcus asaccharovorans]|uniref:hypothetical protein n=1 Tax=Chelatococcus asaccharovorans TaxID=28210 RepID=UPI00226549C5|nr:hypothetical protein [Chelatococcus asaccharovorans]